MESDHSQLSLMNQAQTNEIIDLFNFGIKLLI